MDVVFKTLKLTKTLLIMFIAEFCNGVNYN
jgi:hypothetical protein